MTERRKKMHKELKTAKLTEIKPYENNPRHNDNAVDAVKESIKQCEYIAPIIVDENMVILAGHTRLKALQALGKKEAVVLIVSGLTSEQKRKYRLLDNKTNEFAGWDIDLLELELSDLDFDGFDFGFDIPTDEPVERTDLSGEITAQYQVVVECEDEMEQEDLYNELQAKGYVCRVLTL